MEEKTDRQSLKKADKKSSKINVKSILTGIVIVALIATSVYFWNVARETQANSPSGVAARNQQESSEVVSELKKLIAINSDDKPTVAKIEEPKVLRKSNKDFYANAKVGDYLILYPERAIIFRLDTKKIINIAPIINTTNLNTDNSTDSNDSTKSTEE